MTQSAQSALTDQNLIKPRFLNRNLLRIFTFISKPSASQPQVYKHKARHKIFANKFQYLVIIVVKITSIIKTILWVFYFPTSFDNELSFSRRFVVQNARNHFEPQISSKITTHCPNYSEVPLILLSSPYFVRFRIPEITK